MLLAYLLLYLAVLYVGLARITLPPLFMNKFTLNTLRSPVHTFCQRFFYLDVLRT
uniref:Uncharacterized protein n=1 Tax=Arundo donax TaxID=35708 RepID=A0A0A8ZTC0_ARUDO